MPIEQDPRSEGLRTRADSPYVEVMSFVDLTLLPIRVGLHIADTVLHTVAPESPAPPSELFVVDGMPEGVPAAARRPEPELPAPAGLAVRRGVPAHLWHQPLRRRCPVLDRLPLRRPRRDGSPGKPAERRGAATRHVRLPRRARCPQRRRHLPRRHRPYRHRHLVAGRLEHAARPVCPHRAVHVRHRPRDDNHRRVAGGGGRPLRRHRPRTARFGLWRTADRPHDTRVDTR